MRRQDDCAENFVKVRAQIYIRACGSADGKRSTAVTKIDEGAFVRDSKRGVLVGSAGDPADSNWLRLRGKGIGSRG